MGKKHLAAVAVAVVAVITMLSLQSAQAYPLKQKVTHLQFYFHDRVAGKNVTAVEVASAPSTKTSATFFGKVFVLDDPLTEGPEPTSKLVGKAQGLYASAGQEEFHLLMAVTYVFQGGEFNGSTLAVVGNNAVVNEVREMPIVGGSRKFRLARGYVLAQTHSFDINTNNAIVHYNLTVYHY
ncbi:dirigent protein 23-like [Cryptomeria japonica]|uniref:dirigent protein 23-like n=1 Tax=Cryptomeria japonica TaxID=3369 RepID=UPI0025AD134D|nr:dirigent protein 23-like [Cryptomeria japonica]